MTIQDEDAGIRALAFSFLNDLRQQHGDVLPRQLLLRGFDHEGHRVPLCGPPGIFKPKIMRDMPLSITTVPEIEGKARPYDDEVTPEGLLLYRYRGTDPNHRDNVGLRRAMATKTPLVYLFGVAPGLYAPVYPTFVVGDDAAALSFSVAVAPEALGAIPTLDPIGAGTGERWYATRLTRQRLHQLAFRHRVLTAYRDSCSVCRLKHRRLLDAAHILPDGHPQGEPIVPNGLALCKLHHSAFDAQIIGIRPDLVIEVNREVLREVDGPMLVHGLQGFHERSLEVPRSASLRPRPEFLEERYEIFRAAG